MSTEAIRIVVDAERGVIDREALGDGAFLERSQDFLRAASGFLNDLHKKMSKETAKSRASRSENLLMVTLWYRRNF